MSRIRFAKAARAKSPFTENTPAGTAESPSAAKSASARGNRPSFREEDLAGQEEWKIPDEPKFRLIIESVRNRIDVPDEVFDQIFPRWAREVSKTNWTPVKTALRAAQLLTEGRDNNHILDVGSGVGKFCLIGALSTQGLFEGIEQRPHFVELGRELAVHYHVPRAVFRLGNFMSFDWKRFNGIYLFNPFQENLTLTGLDQTVRRDPTLYTRYASAVFEKAEDMPSGTRIVTYFGYGAGLPHSYVPVVRELQSRGLLELWQKL